MALPTLIATPGGLTSNTYSTMVEANTYHDGHPYGAAWSDGDDDLKVQCLVHATRLLDDLVDWSGYITNLMQALRWPRSGVLDRDGYNYFDPAVIPTFLKRATAEFARYLLIEDRTEERGYGISSITADTVSVDFDKHDVKPVMPPSVTAMIARYGTAQGPGSMMVPLVRV